MCIFLLYFDSLTFTVCTSLLYTAVKNSLTGKQLTRICSESVIMIGDDEKTGSRSEMVGATLSVFA